MVEFDLLRFVVNPLPKGRAASLSPGHQSQEIRQRPEQDMFGMTIKTLSGNVQRGLPLAKRTAWTGAGRDLHLAGAGERQGTGYGLDLIVTRPAICGDINPLPLAAI